MAMNEECDSCGIEPENGELYWNNVVGGGICERCERRMAEHIAERSFAELSRLIRRAVRRAGLAADGIPIDRQGMPHPAIRRIRWELK